MLDNLGGKTAEERVATGLLLLRVSLGLFLFFWAIEKFVLPQTAGKIFKKFYFFEPSLAVTYGIGAFLTVMAILYTIGAFKKWVYLYGFLAHLITNLFSIHRIIDPYGFISGKPKHLFLASVPVMFAFLLVYWMRDRDTKLSFDDRK